MKRSAPASSTRGAAGTLTRRWLALAALVFVVVLLLRPPLRLVLSALPAYVHCEQASGTLWQGQCGEAWLQRAGLPQQIKVQLSWQLLPARLLRGSLAAQLQLSRGGSVVAALLQRRLGSVELLSLNGTVLLEDQLLPGVPAGWHGTATVQDLRARWQGTALTALEGRIRLAQLRSVVAQPVEYGSMVVTWPRTTGGALLPATVVDEGGPLALQATLALQASGAWQLQGTVAARPPVAAALASQLQLLGSAAANGPQQFSIAARP